MRNRRVDSYLHTASRRIIDLLRSRGNRHPGDREKPALETGGAAGQAHHSAVRANTSCSVYRSVDLQSQTGWNTGHPRSKRAIPVEQAFWTMIPSQPIRQTRLSSPCSQASALRAVGIAPVMEPSFTPIATAATPSCAKGAPTRCQVGRGVAGAAVRPRRLAV